MTFDPNKFILFVVPVMILFLPTMIAAIRRHPNAPAIVMLNVLLVSPFVVLFYLVGFGSAEGLSLIHI